METRLKDVLVGAFNCQHSVDMFFMLKACMLTKNTTYNLVAQLSNVSVEHSQTVGKICQCNLSVYKRDLQVVFFTVQKEVLFLPIFSLFTNPAPSQSVHAAFYNYNDHILRPP